MTSFAVTWDYRCPFARNAHEHVIEALQAGAEWEVSYVPFSLGQVHVAEGQPDVWDRPNDDKGLLALQTAVVVRDTFPERFVDVHLGLFAIRHDHGRHLEDQAEIRRVLGEADIDADAVFSEIATSGPLATVRDEHTTAAEEHEVWGVPTFLLGDSAVFVRLVDRPNGNGVHARRSIQRILDLLMEAPELNEFKHTSLKR